MGKGKASWIGRIGGRIRVLLGQERGTTLVELIVTFLLLTIFTTGSVRLMADSMKIYNKIRTLDHAQQVADTLLDKVTGEIEGAQVNMRAKEEDAETPEKEATLKILNGGKEIKLYDRTSSSITIKKDDEGFLVLHYDAVKEKGEQKYKAVDWKFDPKAYMGFKIEDLTFALDKAEAEYPKNVIKVELTLAADGYGDFTNTRYVECYNFVTELDMEKIQEE